MSIVLHNSYLGLPASLRVPHEAARVAQPSLIAWNEPLARALGLEHWRASAARRLSGNRPGRFVRPVALAYAGHQFGHFVPALGDGRALLLGERIDANGVRHDLQLKGSGRTPFSRGGDGKSPLGPVLREYLVSEAMAALGIPTTRALAAVATGEQVVRESVLPGAVLTRVARSHLRVGTFEYAAARGDTAALQALVTYAIERHVDPASREPDLPPALALFDHVVQAQAELVAAWMAAGFVHGVMNTDNTTISGETIDYGPCAFLDEFASNKVFSSIDAHGRYAYGQQPGIAAWNLSRLAGCLMLQHDDRAAYEQRIEHFFSVFERAYLGRMRARFGLADAHEGDAALVQAWLELLEANDLDYHTSWHALAARLTANESTGDPIGEFALAHRERLLAGASRADAGARMARANPVIVARNHQVERAIADGENGDFSTFHALADALRRPFDTTLAESSYAQPPRPAERVQRTFCGT